MSRVLLAGFGALVFGAVFWVVFGAIAAQVFSKMPGGSREGGGAMAGFFFVGPLCGVVGLALGAWAVWRLLANPALSTAVLLGLAATLVLLIAGLSFALRPKIVEPDDFPGRRAEWQIEVSIPATKWDSIPATGRLYMEFRSAEGTEEILGAREGVRREAGRVILPGVLVTRRIPRSKLLALMSNDQQLFSSTLTVEGIPQETTEWCAWQDLEDGFRARWRLVLSEAGQN